MNEEIKKQFEEDIRKGEEIKREMENSIIVKTEKAVYELLKSDGLTLHHSGWYIDYGDYRSFAQLFYAYSKVMENNEENGEYEQILPFLFECKYNKEGNITEKNIIPVRELELIRLPDTIAKVEKKTLGVSGLPTQLPLEVVKMIIDGKHPDFALKDVYLKLLEKFGKYLDMDSTDMKITVLWAIGTYFTDIFGIMPLLIFFGSSGTGKTRALTTTCSLARRGFVITDPTDANLPRIIDAWKPTLGIDDLDEAMRRSREMVMSLLKHTYKNTTRVPRLTPIHKKFFLELFSPFTPVAISTTEPIEEGQLFSRCIFIEMKKSKKKLPNRDPDIFYFKEERANFTS